MCLTMSVKLIFVCLIFHLRLCDCFFGRMKNDDSLTYETKTHMDITFYGAFNAISQYIEETKGASTIQSFYEYDKDNLNLLILKVNALGVKVAETQEERKGKAFFHCHADQIKEAHSYLKYCKQKLLDRKADMDELMNQLAECLYILQSFYSNTNWVEMNGAVVYTDFGVNDLMQVVSQDHASCKDMDNIDHDCKDNILVETKLTSGFHHGRGNTKPPIKFGERRGKCSHGGPEDSSRERVARCGINKDSMSEKLSPHYHLHKAAYQAAVEATKHFLVAPETGVLHILGNGVFEDLFHIKQRRNRNSLSFAVDYTGSMGDDIASVKEQCIEFVRRVLGRENEPVNYVLALFNDPESLTYGEVYLDGKDMIDAISNISVSGGGDCPEYAASGILKAIELSLEGSTVFVFSDADAKDESRAGEVVAAALSKEITLTVLLTGQCSSRKKREISSRIKRTTSFFDDITRETGGNIYHTSKENLGAVLNEVLEDIFPTTSFINETLPVVIIDTFTWNAEDDIPIYVDSSVRLLAIHINDSVPVENISLFHDSSPTEKLSTTMITNDLETSIVLQSPQPGVIYITTNISSSVVWIVNVTAQSNLSADLNILEYTENGDVTIVRGNPITGNKCLVTWTVINLDDGATCQNISVVNSAGIDITVYPSHAVRSEYLSTCSANISVPDKEFGLKLLGKDSNGNRFSRKIYSTFLPATAKVTVKTSTDEAVIGINRNIPFEIISYANEVKQYDVSISNDQGFVVFPTLVQLTMNTGEIAYGKFTITPTVPNILFAYVITLTDSLTGEVQQNITKKLLTTDIERPSCSIISSYASCNDPSISSSTCSLYTWNTAAEITFSGTEIKSISSTGGAYVNLTHDVYQNVSIGPISINIRGHCCYPTVDINVIDVDGHISQCNLDFSYGRESFDEVEIISTPVKHDISETKKSNIVGIATGILLAVVILIVVVIIVVYKYKNKNNSKKIQDSHSDLRSNIDSKERRSIAWIDFSVIQTKSDVVKKPKFEF